MSKRIFRAAFTLIELLVVVSIIAALIATLLPAISKARDVSKTASCMSNQRAIAQMTYMYMNDNRYFLPASQDGTTAIDQFWYTKLAKGYMNLTPYNAAYSYVGVNGRGPERIFLCPAGPESTGAIEAITNLHYGWNFSALTHLDMTNIANQGQTAKLSQIADPASTILTGDSGNGLNYVIKPLNCFWFVGNPAYAPVSRHIEKANYSMVDGHVETLAKNPVTIETAPYWAMRK